MYKDITFITPVVPLNMRLTQKLFTIVKTSKYWGDYTRRHSLQLEWQQTSIRTAAWRHTQQSQ